MLCEWVIHLPLDAMNQSMKPESNFSTPVLAPRMGGMEAPALLFEMLRSFVTLADTLNLSQAVKRLNSTRQTVRRHISQLEESMGTALFTIDDRRYNLTDAGQRSILPAQSLLAQGEMWHQGKFFDVAGLNQTSFEDPSGWYFHQQQQPLAEVWQGTSKLMKASLSAWAQSSGQLEHEAMQVIRPYLLVYRNSPTGWLCMEVGEKSFYSNWWGWTKARSSVGRSLVDFPGGAEVATVMSVPYREVAATQGLRVDQVLTKMPREDGGELIPIAFQRLLMGGYLADGSFVLLVAVDMPDELKIKGVDPDILRQLPPDGEVDFT